MLVVLGLTMVAAFMVVIMTKRATPIVALIAVPVTFGLLAGPVTGIVQMLTVCIKDLAPTAAMLFFDFLLTDGQKAIAGANRIGAIPTTEDPLAGVQTVSVPEEELLNNPQKWNDTYKSITDAGGQA